MTPQWRWSACLTQPTCLLVWLLQRRFCDQESGGVQVSLFDVPHLPARPITAQGYRRRTRMLTPGINHPTAPTFALNLSQRVHTRLLIRGGSHQLH